VHSDPLALHRHLDLSPFVVVAVVVVVVVVAVKVN